MQTGGGGQVMRVPAAGARVQINNGAEDGGARDSSALDAAGRGIGQLAAQVCGGPRHPSEAWG